MTEIRHIGIFLFDGMEELDAVGPWEVLGMWTRLWPDDGWRVLTFAARHEPVRCAKGLTIVPDHGEADRPFLDVLVYPGGQGTRPQVEDHRRLAWVRERAEQGTLMTSVCTGSLVYAAAGLLRDRPATTHWESLERLAELDATIDVRADDRFVDDGEVVTASGVSAGIDMALHLVARLAGTTRASQVRRAMQYDPDPPVPNPGPRPG
jgi:transcriptional regulator GlxA family with amidase domain